MYVWNNLFVIKEWSVKIRCFDCRFVLALSAPLCRHFPEQSQLMRAPRFCHFPKTLQFNSNDQPVYDIVITENRFWCLCWFRFSKIVVGESSGPLLLVRQFAGESALCLQSPLTSCDTRAPRHSRKLDTTCSVDCRVFFLPSRHLLHWLNPNDWSILIQTQLAFSRTQSTNNHQ